MPATIMFGTPPPIDLGYQWQDYLQNQRYDQQAQMQQAQFGQQAQMQGNQFNQQAAMTQMHFDLQNKMRQLPADNFIKIVPQLGGLQLPPIADYQEWSDTAQAELDKANKSWSSILNDDSYDNQQKQQAYFMLQDRLHRQIPKLKESNSVEFVKDPKSGQTIARVIRIREGGKVTSHYESLMGGEGQGLDQETNTYPHTDEEEARELQAHLAKIANGQVQTTSQERSAAQKRMIELDKQIKYSQDLAFKQQHEKNTEIMKLGADILKNDKEERKAFFEAHSFDKDFVMPKAMTPQEARKQAMLLYEEKPQAPQNPVQAQQRASTRQAPQQVSLTDATKFEDLLRQASKRGMQRERAINWAQQQMQGNQ